MLILFAVSAICSYLIGGANGAIIMSKLVYHKDIRDYGSNNPGFTNFKRVFGMNFATVVVFFFDMLKTIVAVSLFSCMFEAQFNLGQLGAVYAGIFCMLGHAYPVWYDFRGGKAFMTWATSIFFIDWKLALIAIAVFLLLLFTVKYMSLSSMSGAVVFAILFAVFDAKYEAETYLIVITKIIPILSAILMIYRHKGNIKRLINKEETKFSLFSRKPALSIEENTQENTAEETQNETLEKIISTEE